MSYKKVAKEETMHMIVLADVTDQEIEQTEFEILKVGDYFDTRYGKFNVTREKLLSLKRNFDDNVLEIDVALDANHEPEGGALAWIKELKVDGDKLLMSLKDVTKRGKEVLKDKVFKYFSVEFAPFTKVEDGKKITIVDVLRGVALTNRPVIKGMAPTFMSETVNKLFITSNMSLFTKFAEATVAKGKVSAEDVVLAKAMFDELTADEQEVEKPALESVEAEAVKTVEAEAEKTELEKKALETGDLAELSETKTKLAETEAKFAELKAKEDARVLSEQVASLTLSEKNTKGFSSAHNETLKGFIATLSEEQFVTFSDLMGKFVAVNIKEIGSGIDGAKLDDARMKVGETTFAVSGADVDMEIKALAESKKISYFEASQMYAESHKS